MDNSDNHTYTIHNVRADQTLSADFAALDKYAIFYSVAAVGSSDNGNPDRKHGPQKYSGGVYIRPLFGRRGL